MIGCRTSVKYDKNLVSQVCDHRSQRDAYGGLFATRWGDLLLWLCLVFSTVRITETDFLRLCYSSISVHKETIRTRLRVLYVHMTTCTGKQCC